MPCSLALSLVAAWLVVRPSVLLRPFPLVVDRAMVTFLLRGFGLVVETSCPTGGDSMRITSAAGLMADSGLSNAQTYCRLSSRHITGTFGVYRWTSLNPSLIARTRNFRFILMRIGSPDTAELESTNSVGRGCSAVFARMATLPFRSTVVGRLYSSSLGRRGRFLARNSVSAGDTLNLAVASSARGMW